MSDNIPAGVGGTGCCDIEIDSQKTKDESEEVTGSHSQKTTDDSEEPTESHSQKTLDDTGGLTEIHSQKTLNDDGELTESHSQKTVDDIGPLTWAQRTARNTTAAAPCQQAGIMIENMVVPMTALPPPVPRDTILDYLLFLAQHSASHGSCGEPQLPEHLQKFGNCVESGLNNMAQVGHARLGLRNDANNCYMNVVVQALLPCSALLWILRRCADNDGTRPFYSCLVRLCKEFHTRKPAESHGEVFNLMPLPQVREVLESWRRLGTQQDAGEFLFYLLNGLHEECKWTVSGADTHASSESDVHVEETEPGKEGAESSGWAHVVKNNCREVESRSAGLSEDSPIARIFGGQIQSAVRASCAKADSVCFEPINHLDLDISHDKVTHVRTALHAFCNAETVNEGQATRRLQFKVLPKVLILALKRFTYNRSKGAPMKIKKPIRYDRKLIFDKEWLADNVEPLDFQISAIICHEGDSVNRGHYKAFVRYNADWYLYDDAVVRRVDPQEVAAQQTTVYLLIYQACCTVSLKP